MQFIFKILAHKIEKKKSVLFVFSVIQTQTLS